MGAMVGIIVGYQYQTTMDFPCLETLKARLLALGEGYHASFYMEVSWEDGESSPQCSTRDIPFFICVFY